MLLSLDHYHKIASMLSVINQKLVLHMKERLPHLITTDTRHSFLLMMTFYGKVSETNCDQRASAAKPVVSKYSVFDIFCY